MRRVEDHQTGRQWAGIDQLVHYIQTTQHAYLRLIVPHLSRMQSRLAAESTIETRSLDRLGRQLLSLATALVEHVRRQEEGLFQELRRTGGQTGAALSLAARRELSRLDAEHRRLMALAQDALTTVRSETCGGRDGLLAELIRDLEQLMARLEEHRRLEVRVLAAALPTAAPASSPC